MEAIEVTKSQKSRHHAGTKKKKTMKESNKPAGLS